MAIEFNFFNFPIFPVRKCYVFWAHENIQYATGRSLEECLITDFRLALRLMDRDDYFEGARAILIDKDRRPYWNPKTIEEVDLKQIDDCFAPLDSEDLAFDWLHGSKQ